MKKNALFAIILVVSVVLTSCSTLGSVASSTAGTTTATSEAYTNGQGAGTALKNLYTQYKSAGKIDMSNLSNIASVLTLTESCKTLKGAVKGSGTYTDFSKGLIANSANLVTTANSETVMESLTSSLSNIDTSSLSNAVSKGTTTVENASSIANSVSNIFSLFQN